MSLGMGFPELGVEFRSLGFGLGGWQHNPSSAPKPSPRTLKQPPNITADSRHLLERTPPPGALSEDVLGSLWDLVATYKWDYNPTYNWGNPLKSI